MSFYHDHPIIPPEAFQELVRERIAERKQISKDRRQKFRMTFMERKSKDGIEPLELFPKEIWLEILNHVSPEDRWNTCQVHPAFPNIMKDNLIRDILFPQALKLVLDHVRKNEKIGWGTRIDIRDSDLSPFLKLREVSKSLRLAVDRWLEERIIEDLHELERRDKCKDWNPLPVMIFNHLSLDLKRVNGLIENYNCTGTGASTGTGTGGRRRRYPVRSKRAFFLRSIEIDMILGDLDEIMKNNALFPPVDLKNELLLPFKPAMIKLLELVGDQILCFKMRINPEDLFDGTGYYMDDLYLLLGEYCQLMPNLKKLEVYFQTGANSSGFAEVAEGPTRRVVSENSFPSLWNLERISFEQDKDIWATFIIYDAILKENRRVKTLRFKMEDDLFPELSRFDLECLNLKCFSWHNTAEKPDPKYGRFLCWRQWFWCLTSLDLMGKLKNVSYVFHTLEKFPNLEKVTLFLMDMVIGSGLKFLNLPNLKDFNGTFRGRIDLERDDVNFLFSLQFLIKAKRLQKLRWQYIAEGLGREKYLEVQRLTRYLQSHECPDKMLDFRGGWRDLKSSNIWKVFPELESVDLVVYNKNGERTRQYHIR